jgi:uncharacterized protein with PIN domain
LRFSFIAESTLGKLTKLLRMAGFDTRMIAGKPDPVILEKAAQPHRLILTRTRHVYSSLASGKALLLLANLPDQQIKELFSRLGIQRRELKPLTRCILCNDELVAISQEQVVGRLPDFTYQYHQQYRQCTTCGRLYWPGSHASRMSLRINAWFDCSR